MKIFLLLLAVVAGAMLPVQATLNAKMAKFADSPVVSALLSFLIGTVALIFYALVTESNLYAKLLSVRHAPSYVWLPGLLGAFYVVGSVALLPRLGVALTFSLVVAGQMLVTVVFDHYGLLGGVMKPINLFRVIGIFLIIGGVILIRKF